MSRQWMAGQPFLDPTNLEHSPVLTDQVTYSFDHSGISSGWLLDNRDAIFRDLFGKLAGHK